MSEWSARDSEGVSILALLTVLVSRRMQIARWAFVGTVLGAGLALTKPTMYVASAELMPQGADASRSGLASLAGQLGVSIPTNNQTLTPDFYARLLRSNGVLNEVVRDSIDDPEGGAGRVRILDVLAAQGETPAKREANAIWILKQNSSASVIKTASVVTYSVTTRWPSVSQAIAERVLEAINQFNIRSRQSQASAERRFVEDRQTVARTELLAAEDRMKFFSVKNRSYAGSPELEVEHDRLNRDVVMRQQVYTSLAQSYEEARIREVRDTPIITIVLAPEHAVEMVPRGRVKLALAGFLLGGVIGAMLAVLKAWATQRRAEGDLELSEFDRVAATFRQDLLRLFGRLSKAGR